MIEQPPYVELEEQAFRALVQTQASGSLKKIQDEYLYWDKVKYKAKGVSPLELWSAVKVFRRLGYKGVKFGSYSFKYLITDFMERALHQFDMNIGGALSSNIGIAEADKNKFVINSLIEEAISSSQMEGASTTRKRAKEMIRKEQRVANKSERMILNNYLTMKYISANKDKELTSELLLEIHRLIVSGTLDNPDEEGVFRANDNVYVVNHSVSEVVHTPPSHQEVTQLIDDLCIFFNTDGEDFIHPIVKGCIIHFMIGWIHPFADGNGRTARAIFYWYMLKNGYWMTEFLAISRIIQRTKNQYEKAYLYVETDENDLGYFITYKIKTLEKAFQDLKAYLNKKQQEVKQATNFVKIPGVNERMAQVLRILDSDPDRILNIKEVQSRFDVSDYTARSDLKALVGLGFLEVVQVNKQKQNFIRSDGFDDILAQYLHK